MNIDQFFYKNLTQHEATPPASVWDKILSRIASEGIDRFLWFSVSEKKFILGSFILSTLLGLAFMQYISSETRNQLTAQRVYTKPQITSAAENKTSFIATNKISANRLIRKTSLEPSKNKQEPSIHRLTASEIKTIKGLKKEISLVQEIVHIEKQIDSIENVQWAEAKALENTYPSLIANSANHSTLIPSNVNAVYTLPAAELALSEEKDAHNPFNHRGIYMTPFFGGNFTQVYYQSTPNNPYFTDKAVFTGKIGYNVGTQIGYQFNKHWSIESGISFGQYIQSFRESLNQVERKGHMYIDQLDLPLAARFSINFGDIDYPKSFSFKSGVIYNSVTQYQVNYTDKNYTTKLESEYHIDADKRLYNSLQLGYILGFDFDAFISKKISLNIAMLNSIVSQFNNFPFFKSDIHRPIQYSSTFSIGTKIRF
jgi:hypothetical protein